MAGGGRLGRSREEGLDGAPLPDRRVAQPVPRHLRRAPALLPPRPPGRELVRANARPSSLLRRFAAPEEVAALVVFVCSPLASATNGAALRVDGGVVRSVV